MSNEAKRVYKFIALFERVLHDPVVRVVLITSWTLLVAAASFIAGVGQLDPRVSALERHVDEVTVKIDKIYDYIVLGTKP